MPPEPDPGAAARGRQAFAQFMSGIDRLVVALDRNSKIKERQNQLLEQLLGDIEDEEDGLVAVADDLVNSIDDGTEVLKAVGRSIEANGGVKLDAESIFSRLVGEGTGGRGKGRRRR